MPTRTRLSLAAALSLALFLPLAARLAQLQLVEHRRLAAMARQEVSRESLELVPRGRILDREGRVLAQSLPSHSAFLETAAVRRPDAAARELAAALGLDRREVLRRLRSGSRFQWLKRKLSPEEVSRLKALRLEGVGLTPDETRHYPNGDLALGLLGTVGAEGRGLAGLELAFDRELSGKARRLALLRDGSGKTLRPVEAPAVEPPPDLRLTLDRTVQHYAEAALAEAVARHRPASASILVQDPRTGELLASAAFPATPLRNPALQDAYEPGSTLKIVTMTAALEEGVVRPDAALDCEGGRWEVSPGTFVKDHEPYGALSLEGVMEKSSNIGTGKLGLLLGTQRFWRHARAFGLGSRTALSLPGESPGLLKSPEAMSRVVLVNNAFGQGLAVTPLQLVGAFSALANGGSLLEPRVVLSLGPAPESPPEPVRVRRVASVETVRRVSRMLEGVVDRGTGVTAAVPGYSVAGKTGTAQRVDPRTRKYSTTDYVASFAGFAPASDPRFTVLVVLDSPRGAYYGAEVAAPVFAKLVRRLLALRGVPLERPLPLRTAPEPAASGPARPAARPTAVPGAR